MPVVRRTCDDLRAFFATHCTQGPRVRVGTRHSLRPLIDEGDVQDGQPGHILLREREGLPLFSSWPGLSRPTTSLGRTGFEPIVRFRIACNNQPNFPVTWPMLDVVFALDRVR